MTHLAPFNQNASPEEMLRLLDLMRKQVNELTDTVSDLQTHIDALQNQVDTLSG